MAERTSLSQAPAVQAHLQPLMRLAEQTTVQPGANSRGAQGPPSSLKTPEIQWKLVPTAPVVERDLSPQVQALRWVDYADAVHAVNREVGFRKKKR
jgi:hypothetical protein